MENNVNVKKIVLYNSASYAYFEMDLDKHILLEGKNNIGKTSVLNILQLLFLPENNLNNLNTKFAMSSGNDAKKYTGRDTYNYYFPEENSFALIEVENKFTTFCVLLYRKNESKLTYVRHIFDTKYSEIKNLVIKDKELQSTSVSQLVNDLKIKIPSHKEIKEKKDIKEVLYSPQGSEKTSKFNLVPLKDTKESTIGHFSILFKSLYNISNLNKENKKQLIADIITTQNLDKDKHYDLNLHDLIIKYKDNQKQKDKIEVLRSEEDTYNFIKEYYTEQEVFKSNIENQAALLLLQIQKDIKVITSEYLETSKNKDKIKLELEEKKNIQGTLIEHSKECVGDLKSVKKDEQKIVDQMTYLQSHLKKTLYREENINKDFMLSHQNDILDFFSNEQNSLIDKINFLKKDILELKEKHKDNSNTQNDINNVEKDISKIFKQIKHIEEQLSNQALNESEEFSLNEKRVLETIFNDNFLKNNINKLSKNALQDIKTFLNIFNVEENYISLDEINIQSLNKPSSQLEDELEYLRKDLITKENRLKTLKTLESKSLEATIQQKEIVLRDSETKLKNIENLIHFVKNINESEIEYKRLVNKRQDLQEEVEQNNSQQKEIREIISSLESLLSETTNKLNKLYGEEEREKSILDELSSGDIELFFDRDVKELRIINENEHSEYTDNKARFKIIKDNINQYNKTKQELETKMYRFIQKKTFEEASDDTTLNYTENRNYRKLFDYLEGLYGTLNEKEEFINNEIESQAQETAGAVNILKEAKSDIKALEKMINEEFNKLTISDLKGVRFKININKELDDKIKELDNNIDVNKSYLKEIIEVNNYLQNHSDDTGIIRLDTLIKDIQYETLIEGEYVETTQSNGTETMITLVFITLLFKEIFRSGYRFKIPIPVDEIGKVDIRNVNTLLNVLTDRKFTLVGALPNMIPEFRELFPRTISIGNVELEKPFNHKRVLLVEPSEDIFNMFEVEDLKENAFNLSSNDVNELEIELNDIDEPLYPNEENEGN